MQETDDDDAVEHEVARVSANGDQQGLDDKSDRLGGHSLHEAVQTEVTTREYFEKEVKRQRKRKASELESGDSNAMERALRLMQIVLHLEKWGYTELARDVADTAKNTIRSAGITSRNATDASVWKEERSQDLLKAAVWLGVEEWGRAASDLLDEASKSRAAEGKCQALPRSTVCRNV